VIVGSEVHPFHGPDNQITFGIPILTPISYFNAHPFPFVDKYYQASFGGWIIGHENVSIIMEGTQKGQFLN
jgi:hypothetical protein